MSEPLTSKRDNTDAKAWFYLDHRDDIETWAQLRSEARALLDKHLVGIEAELEPLAEELGAELQTADLDAGSWSTVSLSRATWQHDGVTDIDIDIDIVAQWERVRLLTPGSNEWPYVAVRVAHDLADDGRRQRINEALRPVRAQFNGRPGPNFPCWRYVRPAIAAPVDPDTLVRDLVSSFRQPWHLAAPLLEGQHTAVPGTPAPRQS